MADEFKVRRAKRAIVPVEIGQRFNRLKVLCYAGPIEGHKSWECLCDCGKLIIARGTALTAGKKSCGCQHVEALAKCHTKHSDCGSRTYVKWRSMKDRCTNPNAISFQNYGARGISVCQRWMDSYIDFLTDMGVCPDSLEIDRIDSNGNYEPGNCRWVTREVNQNNRRVSIRLEFNGQVKMLKEWAELLCLNYQTLRYRVRHGWSAEKALKTPGRSA